jgi:hypothetical protein
MTHDTEKQEASEVVTPSGNPDQKWVQSDSFRFNTYEEARAKFDALDVARKRVRARDKGKFDVVVYAPLIKPTKKRKPSAKAQA